MRKHYRALFQQQTERSMRYLLRRIEQDTCALFSPEDQQILLNALPHAFKFPVLWPLTSRLLLTVAPLMEQAGHHELWIPYLEEGLQLSRSLQDDTTRAALHFHLGVLDHLRNQCADAIMHFQESVTCSEASHDCTIQAKAMNRWAYVACCQQCHAVALDLVTRALALLDEASPERGYSYFVQGILVYDQAEYAKAADWFQQAIAVWKHVDEQRMVAWNLTNLGLAFHGLQVYDAALAAYEKAIAIFQIIYDPAKQAIAEMNIGNIYLMQKEPLLALDAYMAAEPVLRQMQDELHLTKVYTNQGIAYRQLQQWEKASERLIVAIENWEHLRNLRSLANATMELGLVYLEQGSVQKAISKFHRALACLEQMRDQPGYAPLVTEVTGHLAQAVRHHSVPMLVE